MHAVGHGGGESPAGAFADLAVRVQQCAVQVRDHDCGAGAPGKMGAPPVRCGVGGGHGDGSGVAGSGMRCVMAAAYRW